MRCVAICIVDADIDGLYLWKTRCSGVYDYDLYN